MTTPTETGVVVRPAQPDDVAGMMEVMMPFIESGDLLPKTPVDVSRDLETYVVATGTDGQVVGTGSLRRFTPQLCEIQALAVSINFQGGGVGRQVVEALVAEAEHLGVVEVFALTRRTDFFERLGFAPAGKDRFPDKIWSDCVRCPRRDACDEVAVNRMLS